jgi:hypothetical protein
MIRQVLALVVVLGVAGEAGHLLLDALHADLAHHVLHLTLPLVAVVIFGWLMVRDIRQHGWPSFSWRLDPSQATVRGSGRDRSRSFPR